jgi:hypothetical protein
MSQRYSDQNELPNRHFRVAAWKDAPSEWAPALVLLASSEKEDGIVSILLKDSPDFSTGVGILLLPATEIEKYFLISEGGICPDELAIEFSIMQAYLIENNLPMMGPLFYLRTATMMKHDKLECHQAISANSKIETEMLSWVKKSADMVKAIPQLA